MSQTLCMILKANIVCIVRYFILCLVLNRIKNVDDAILIVAYVLMKLTTIEVMTGISTFQVILVSLTTTT